MKAVRSGNGGVSVVELDEPPGSGVLLDMEATSICASDLSYIRFGSTNVLGHELAGRRSDGTPVVVEAIYGCLECEQCRRGAYNLCPTHSQRALGIFADGGMAEQFYAPPERLVDVPPGLDLPRRVPRRTDIGVLACAASCRHWAGHRGSRSWEPAPSDCWPWRARGRWGLRT